MKKIFRVLFALFVILSFTLPAINVSAVGDTLDSYTGSDNSGFAVYGSAGLRDFGETYTATTTTTVGSVSLKIYKVGSVASDLEIDFWLADSGTNLPTTKLASGNLTSGSITSSSPGEYYVVTFDSPVSQTAGNKYSVTATTTLGDGSNNYQVRYINSDDYANGISVKRTTTWSTLAYDTVFVVYGEDLSPTPTITTNQAYRTTDTGNFTFPMSLAFYGTENITELGIEWAVYTDSFGSNSMGDSVNYGENVDYNLSLSPDDMGLVANTIYKYRAYANYDSTNVTGNARYFTYVIPPTATTLNASSITSTSVILTGVRENLNSGGNITSEGFYYGTSNGTWSGSVSDSVNTSTVGIGTGGTFSLAVSSLIPNTTYYYVAFCTNSNGTGYGDVKTFDTLDLSETTNVPVVQTAGISLVGSDSETGLQKYTFAGNIIQSDTAIVLSGIQYSVVVPDVSTINLYSGIVYQQGTFNGTYDNYIYSLNKNLGLFTVNSDYSISQGAQIYWRAFAQNSAGLGFSDNTTYTSVNEVGFVPITVQSVVAGNSVTLYGGWSGYLNPSASRVYYFSYGTTTNGDTNTVIVDGSDFKYVVGGLETNTTYYWRAGVKVSGNLWWSDLPAGQFITQSTIVAITGVVNLTTNPVVSAALTSFVGSMTINSVNSGNATQIGFYVSYNSNGSGGFRLPIANSGDYGTGTYTNTVAGLNASALVYYAGFAVNPAGEIVGAYLPVQLSASGSNPNVPSNPAITGLSARILQIARSQGLDNSLGRYFFMFEIMILADIPFIIGIIALVSKNKDSIAKILAGITVALDVLIAISFVLTGWLGIWPFIILGAIVVLVIIIFGSIILNRGSAG